MSKHDSPTVTSIAPKPAWGGANPRRGTNGTDPALAFIQTFPVGSTLTPEGFDAWAQTRGLLPTPNAGDKQSDSWKAHLQRRHELRYRINRAGTHPRMTMHGATPFIIEATHAGSWEVRAPELAIAHSKIPRQVESLITTKKRSLGYLMQSADWSILPPWERIFADSLYDDIAMFADSTSRNAYGLEQKFVKLQIRLKEAVDAGMVAQSPAIQQMLALDEAPTPPADDLC